ncbi:MAG TPA: glycine zipper domain-containing protein [Candidatus Methylomirabilis sp.]|nr:glycine zipper domain-containing protein [Candidatus Methylomirabilis sp.]
MRSAKSLLLVVLVAGLAVAGCETLQENPKTAIGVGAGAAGGALVGGLIGHNTTGVVVGGLAGSLVGGAIGYYLDRQDKTAAQAAADTGYQPSQGVVVRVDKVVVDPSVVAPGGTEYLGVTYTVLTPTPNQTVQVNETREVRHNGALVANPTSQFTRENGTFTSALPITLPANAARGTYEVTTSVTVTTLFVATRGERTSRGIATFAVK